MERLDFYSDTLPNRRYKPGRPSPLLGPLSLALYRSRRWKHKPPVNLIVLQPEPGEISYYG